MYQYGILDCAKDQQIYPLITQCTNFKCMFGGRIEPPMDTHAPYIVEMKQDEPLMETWRENWAENWGILVHSKHSLAEVRRHLRKFLLAQLPDGSTALFRFYDPRVLTVYFGTLSQDEAAQWFEKINEYWLFSDEVEGGLAKYRV